MKVISKTSVIMANVKMFKLLGVALALMLIAWGLSPIFRHQALTNDVIATAIILILIGVAYLIILYNPSWTKAVFFFEGIVIAVAGYMLLDYPYSLELVLVGLFIIAIAILAYLEKLPPKILKWFYR